ncbi:MAG: Rpn family recombination-promoting nuclease/putative transposase [Synechococcaceae cyanobacterium SM2_3_2]|nr:Rpn family recombination-promoting nuclease/putative transposase [Synechococcaceae cyanobacterium SM2_3_2]
MAPKADIGSKRLIGLDPQGWIRWITRNPEAIFREMLNSKFEWISREGDVLIRAWDPDLGEHLIANEIQLRYSAKMPRRIRAYTALAEEKYQLPVYPVLVVILPGPDRIPTQYTSTIRDLEARQDYKVIQLSEVEAELVFSQPLPTLLPFVPIMQGGEQEEIIRHALQILQRDPVLSEMEPLLAFFARFVLSSEVVAQIMRWDMAVLRESPWYEEIKQEGILLGKQEGIQQVVMTMLRKGIPIEQVAELTELSLERIQQLASSTDL